MSELGDPLVPGLAAAAMLQVNRDPKFAALMAADERQTLTTLTALLDRMAEDGADLPFPPARVARWVASIIDSLFLSAMEEDFDPESHLRELRRITAWLTGRA
ncbi:hypothetical protein ACFTE1_08245 [Salininema proteolyticum]|uniref:hypothetical protein n=1 Tax=Salininema proteolyticum TaxID=1607685 RepID=UPI003632AE9A